MTLTNNHKHTKSHQAFMNTSIYALNITQHNPSLKINNFTTLTPHTYPISHPQHRLSHYISSNTSRVFKTPFSLPQNTITTQHNQHKHNTTLTSNTLDLAWITPQHLLFLHSSDSHKFQPKTHQEND